MTGAVRIERLVLELPGIDAVQARELAQGVAEGLAGDDLAGDHAALSIAVDPQTAARPERLAAEIVRQLLAKIG